MGGLKKVKMKEIKTNGITILLIEVPEDAKLLQITQNASGRNLSYKVNNTTHPFGYTHIKLPEGNYQILGKSTELSEEQMKEIVERKDWLWGKMTYLSSYLSLLEANGIVDRNPFDKSGMTFSSEYQNKWQESQSKVKHYLVLKRI